MRTISPFLAFTEWRTRMSASRCTCRSDAMDLPFRRGSLPALDRLDGRHLAAGLLDLLPGAVERHGVRRLQVEGVAGVREGRRLEPELPPLLHVEVEHPVPLLPDDAVGPDEDGAERGLDHLVGVGAAHVPGDPFLDFLQSPPLQHPDPLERGEHFQGLRLAARVRDAVHLPGDLLDPVRFREQDRHADVVEVVVHPGEGEHAPLLEPVHLAIDDPPENLLVVLGQPLDRLVLHRVPFLPAAPTREVSAAPPGCARPSRTRRPRPWASPGSSAGRRTPCGSGSGGSPAGRSSPPRCAGAGPRGSPAPSSSRSGATSAPGGGYPSPPSPRGPPPTPPPSRIRSRTRTGARCPGTPPRPG